MMLRLQTLKGLICALISTNGEFELVKRRQLQNGSASDRIQFPLCAMQVEGGRWRSHSVILAFIE